MGSSCWLEDQYADGTHLGWRMSDPTPELRAAVEDDWLPRTGTVVDVGCGLGDEAAFLAGLGIPVVGIDLAQTALRLGRQANPAVRFVRADVRRLPMAAGSVTAVLDRGCFHYLQVADRPAYVAQMGRVLAPDGRLLLRACLPHEWMEQNLNERVLAELFTGWRIDAMGREDIPVDGGNLGGIVARLRRPS